LDIRTLAFSYVVTTGLCAGLMVLLWRQNRNRFEGTGLWMVDFIFQALALFLIVLRGSIPDSISMVLANTLVMVGAVLGFMGQERFLARQGPQVHNYLLLTLFILVQGYFALVQPNLAARNLNISVTLLLICGQSVWLMWHRVETGRRGLTFSVGAVYLMYCLVSGVRIFHILSGAPHEDDYFKPMLFEALLLLAYQVLLIALAYSLVDLVNKQLTLSSIDDMAQRQMARAALQESETRYRNLTEWSPQPLAVHDGKQLLYANPAAIRMLGAKDARDLVGKSIFNMIHPDSREAVRERLKAGIEQIGAMPMIEEKLIRLDGSTIDVEVQSTSVIYQGASVVQVAMRDVTQSKRDQEKLLFLSRRTQVLLELSSVAEHLSETAFLQHGLEKAEQLTGSQIGFVHFVQEDQQSIELVTWSKATLDGYCTAAFDRHYPINQAGIWADALRRREPVLINDYASAAGKHGLPEGHAHLQRLISVPVLDGGLVRMMMGVGNKPQPYLDQDMEATRLIAEATWRIASMRRSDQALRESERRMSAVFQSSPIGIVISRVTDGEILEVNDAALRLYQYTREEALGHTAAELGTYVNPQQRIELLKRLRERGSIENFLIDFRTHDARLGVLELSGRVIELRDEACLLAMMTDVTERQRSQAVIHDQAFHDALTQLPNRRLLGNRLQQAMMAAKRRGCYGALMFVDLDNFKPLNDSQGHDVGDLLLIEVAARLRSCVREVDTVARVGGDEFVVMLTELNRSLTESTAQAAAVAEKIRSALSNPYRLAVHRDGEPDRLVEHRCSASIGVVLFVNDQVSQNDMINRADAAMYRAKRGGRNSIQFHEAQI
jgi:diguanylate cyclase (GGDEF)-like protein/PAS domain S-box-containing protein